MRLYASPKNEAIDNLRIAGLIGLDDIRIPSFTNDNMMKNLQPEFQSEHGAV